jgi:hypothetical protein
MRFGTMFKPNLLASKKAGFFVNKKNNTRRELGAENLRKSLLRGEQGASGEAGAFLMCTESGASVAVRRTGEYEGRGD